MELSEIAGNFRTKLLLVTRDWSKVPDTSFSEKSPLFLFHNEYRVQSVRYLV